MRVLRVVMVATVVASVAAAPGGAHPPEEPAHGVNETTFPTLWSGDVDGNVTTGSEWLELATGTDVAVDDPPAAVTRWNRGELGALPASGPDISVVPMGVTVTDGRFVRDAYVTAFAIEPSTRVLMSPAAQPTMIAPNGTVLVTLDYRIELPAADTEGDRRVEWSLEDHAVTEFRLLADGRVLDTAAGAQTATLAYDGLGAATDTLRVEADIETTVRRLDRIERRRCETVNNTTTCRTWWDETVRYPTESVTVGETVDVTVEVVTIGGARAVYPNGDLGLILEKDRPWRGFDHPDGRLRGVWRFYTMRDPDWDRLETRTATGTTTAHSPVHPLRTVAFPIETGPTAHPAGTIAILDTIGVDILPPVLPSTVALDVVTEPYRASFGVAVRVRTTEYDVSALTAHGLVRGNHVTARAADFEAVPIHRSRLDLAVGNETADAVAVEIRLGDAETGAPINTLLRAGYLLVNGERRETGYDGTVVAVVPRGQDGVSVRYVPDRWWNDVPAYSASSSAIGIVGEDWDLVGILYGLGMPISLFLLGIFIIDRFSAARLWPPWRRL